MEIATVSVAVLLPVSAAGYDPPEMLAVLVNNCPDVPLATATRRLIGLPELLAAMTAVVVQVTICVPTLPAQLHPAPVAGAAIVMPLGRVSTIVITPDVGVDPILRGVRVKTPVEDPSPKLAGAWVLLMARSGADAGTSAKLLAAEILLLPVKLMPTIVLLVAVGLLAVPPVLPAVVRPLVVALGWLGWVIV